MEWEPADNTMDAQLHLDAFQRQYDQLVTSHDELVAMGRSIAKETEQLDSELFGRTTHPVGVKVERFVERLESSVSKMHVVAAPRLQERKDCLQFHLLQQRANKVRVQAAEVKVTLLQVELQGLLDDVELLVYIVTCLLMTGF